MNCRRGYNGGMKIIVMVLMAGMVVGCASVNVGASLPIPGPVRPYVGTSISRSGIKGHGGVSTGVGPVSVGVGGTTEELKFKNESKKVRK